MQSYNTLHLKLPDQVFKWIEANRGEQSRSAFIISCLKQIRDVDMHNTEINQYEVNNERTIFTNPKHTNK